MTEVNLKFTADMRARVGVDSMVFSFEGSKLGDLLEALCARYEIRDLLIDDSGNVLPYSRIVVNGRFSYLLEDMETSLEDGDLIVLIRPYAVAF